MLIFSNHSEGFVLKAASFLCAGAGLLPILLWINGRVSSRDAFLGFCLFLTMTIMALILRRSKTIEVRLSGQFIDVIFPFKQESFQVRYDEIQEVNFSDFGMSLSLRLKSGKNISLGSTIHRQSGEFSVPELGPAAVQGKAGERLRLKSEIESRMAAN